jgi:uncharacterized protein (DUF488 family)
VTNKVKFFQLDLSPYLNQLEIRVLEVDKGDGSAAVRESLFSISKYLGFVRCAQSKMRVAGILEDVEAVFG